MRSLIINGEKGKGLERFEENLKNQSIEIDGYITYLPHKAVAEVSKDKEPIGRACVEFKWFESQSVSDSKEYSNDLVINWFDIQMILVAN